MDTFHSGDNSDTVSTSTLKYNALDLFDPSSLHLRNPPAVCMGIRAAG